jgi:hypothetical protein
MFSIELALCTLLLNFLMQFKPRPFNDLKKRQLKFTESSLENSKEF